MRSTAYRRVLFGGTNFMSPSFDPSTGLFCVSARETCMTFTVQVPPEGYKAGDRTMGGTLRAADRGYGALRAIDPVTGERKWELRHPTPSWAGVLSTSGGVVFSGDNEGDAFAADSRTGKELRSLSLNIELGTLHMTPEEAERGKPDQTNSREARQGARSPGKAQA